MPATSTGLPSVPMIDPGGMGLMPANVSKTICPSIPKEYARPRAASPQPPPIGGTIPTSCSASTAQNAIDAQHARPRMRRFTCETVLSRSALLSRLHQRDRRCVHVGDDDGVADAQLFHVFRVPSL